MNSLLRIFAVVHKEFLQLSRDRTTFGMIVMIPLVQLLLFGYAINNVVRDIPAGVVDLSGSAGARFVIAQVGATQVVKFVARYRTPAEAERAIVAGDIRAALILPADFSQRAASGDTLGQWLVDGSDTVISSAMLPLRSMPLHLESGAPPKDYRSAKPSFEVALFFNPERRSVVNIVPGLTAIILTMTMVMFTSISLVRERENGNLELLITTPIRPLELMVGKIAPFIVVGVIQVLLVLGLGHIVFDVPLQGDLLSLSCITLAFIAASLTLGLLFSTIASTQLQSMQLTFFILIPSILLSGFMFPYEAMPVPAQYIAEVLPATHFMRLIRAVMVRGAPMADLLQDIGWLIAFTIIVLSIATARFHKSLD